MSIVFSQMTTKQTLQALRRAGKPLQKSRLYQLFTDLEIKPARRQRPAIYPADTAERILVHLGFITTAAAVVTPEPTMRELRRARATSKGRVK